jgi:prepilin-type N-terminal cleavage/methylation domain-containing protein
MQRDVRNLIGSRGLGFTLIEVVIVVLIIALFAGIIIPRMTGMGKRVEGLTVDKVADLLSAFGYRDSIASGTTAIEYSESTGSLTLLTLRPDPDNPEDPSIWSRDMLAPIVTIPTTMTLRAYEDGKLLPDSNWSIITNTDGTRPKIEMELTGEATESSLVLDPWAQGPFVVDELNHEIVLLPDSFDLDAAGQDQVPW